MSEPANQLRGQLFGVPLSGLDRAPAPFDWTNTLPVVCGILLTCLGLGVIIGWHLGVAAIVQLHPTLVSMPYNAALCFFLLGGGLISATLGQARAPQIAGAVVAVIGLLSGLQYLLAQNFGIDQLLFEATINVQTSSPGRMAPNTAACFIMSGVAVALIGYRVRRDEVSSLAIVLGSLTVGLGLVAIVGYVSGLESAYGWGRFTNMALHSAIGFLVAGVGVTVFHWPRARDQAVDIGRLTSVLISLTTFGVLLVVLLAAGIGLIPLYEQLRDSRDQEITQELTREVGAIENLLDRTSGLASQIDLGGSSAAGGQGLDSLSGEALAALANALEKLERWRGPGKASLGILQSTGASVLVRDDATGAFRLARAPSSVATGITRAVQGEVGLIAGTGEAGKELAFFSPVMDTAWAVVVLVDSVELYAAADRRLLLIALAVLLVALAGSLGIARLLQPLTSGILIHSQDMQRRIHEATSELERNLRELERTNRELEQFAYVVSHDLQAPLRGIDGFAGLLERRNAEQLDEDGREYLQLIRQAVLQMREFIQGLLTLSRVDTQREPLQPVNLADVVEQVKTQLQFALEDASAVIEYDDLPEVMGDALQLGQLFQNLIDNAIKFRSPERDLRIFIKARREEAFWHFEVADNGRGIDPSQRERVFDLFHRPPETKELQGTGIGLALCRKIVSRHGGDIHVREAPEQGACFVFTLPAF